MGNWHCPRGSKKASKTKRDRKTRAPTEGIQLVGKNEVNRLSARLCKGGKTTTPFLLDVGHVSDVIIRLSI